MKKVILIIASQGYQPLEYGQTREVLEEAGIEVLVASDKPEMAHASPSASSDYATAHVDLAVNTITVDDYDGIFIIGGGGAPEHLDNQATYHVMQKAAHAKKPFGAICISPRILAHAGLLKGKKATGWNGDKKLDIFFDEHGVTYIKEPVVTDGNIITADGPRAAQDFGKAIVTLING